ncbi:hypothetical protein CVT25_006799 [Psilocybe cyanescens]|uniref:F-box domain-containing protein n=1 Tax=Psilocybe cyanescens TaxID=93625 RepID=A0A409X7A0_PSICY|nr:hypothetical protein CVT25_006799 [Psilocybe cyanescens]
MVGNGIPPSADVSTSTPFLLVCKTAHEWMLPFLYHSVKFTTAGQLSKFLSSHDLPDDLMESSLSPPSSRLDLIQNIHIGETPSEKGNLEYGSTNWPLTVLTRLLWLTRSLKRLTILNLDQNKWRTFEHAVPASLEYLALGPIHGPFRPQDLKQKPPLKMFTSVLTYMRDDEVQDAVCYPTMRRVRRMLESSSMAPHWAIEQVGCVSKSPALERMEIVLLGREQYTEIAAAVMKEQAKIVSRDPRVAIVEDNRSWVKIIYQEWDDYRLQFLRAHTD